MTATDLIESLNLRPLEFEGGYYRETYRSAHSSAIYYLLTPETFSRMHRLPTDEIYHFYCGDAVELLILDQQGQSGVITLGHDIGSGEHVQYTVHGGKWQGSRLVEGGKVALMGTTMAPGFDFTGFEGGVRKALLASYPEHEARIRALTPD